MPASRIEMGDRTAVETTGRPPGRRKKLAGHRGVSHSHIMASLSRVLGSRAFDGSKSLKLLLKHLLMKLLCSEADQIKEYSLGVDVFNRRETFDPRLDSIVRVQARRLRQKLKEYYNTEGRNETIRIYLPKGCYIPVIYTHSPVDLPCGPNSKRCRIAVLPFRNLSSGPADHFIDILTEGLIAELTQSTGLDVIAGTSAFMFKRRYQDVREIGNYLNVDAVLEGSVQRSTRFFRVNSRLVNAKTGFTVWGRAVDLDPNLDPLLAQKEVLGSVIPPVRTLLEQPERAPSDIP